MTNLDISSGAVAGATYLGRACTSVRDGGKGIAGSVRPFGPECGLMGCGDRLEQLQWG